MESSIVVEIAGSWEPLSSSERTHTPWSNYTWPNDSHQSVSPRARQGAAERDSEWDGAERVGVAHASSGRPEVRLRLGFAVAAAHRDDDELGVVGPSLWTEQKRRSERARCRPASERRRPFLDCASTATK